MSLAFSDVSGGDGIIQKIEAKVMNLGDISGNTTRLKVFTAKVNQGLDSFTKLAIEAAGTQQYEDSNHTKYGIIKTNLVQGQRDYSFLTDEQGNYILDVFKVAILPSATATDFQELDPFDELDDVNNAVISENTGTGVPTRYGKLGNSIFFDIPTSYNATNGLKLYVNRESSYFTTSDTTKVPGIPGIFHHYLVLWACEDYAADNLLSNFAAIREQRILMEQDIKNYFGRRERDVRKQLGMKPITGGFR